MKRNSKITKIIVSALLIASLAVTAVPVYSLAKAKVKLNKTKITLYVGKTATLKLKNNKQKVKWSSSNKKVATVSSKGKVKGIKKGKATITAKVGKKKYTCKVTVKAKNTDTSRNTVPTQKPTAVPTGNPMPSPTQVPVAGPTATPTVAPTQRPTNTPVPELEYIYFEQEEVELKLHEKTYLEVKPYPEGAKIPTIRWEVSDPDVVHFWLGKYQKEYFDDHYDSDVGWLRAKVEVWLGDYGTTTFTAHVNDLTATCEVTVPAIEAELELSEDGTVLKDCKNGDRATVVNIPNTVTRLETMSLARCLRVKSIEIPSSVTIIEERALSAEYGLSTPLKSLYIPSSVTEIGQQFFPETCTIYGESGSYAEQWAGENSYTFVVR